VVSVSNQDSETRYAARPKGLRPGDVLSRLARRLDEIATMHESWSRIRGPGTCTAIVADARSITRGLVGRVDAVVTSPPYANAFDYHLYHRHRMFWLGYDPSHVGQQEIGSHLNNQRGRDGIASFREDMRLSIPYSMGKSLTMQR
jgi:hypothetical protein